MPGGKWYTTGGLRFRDFLTYVKSSTGKILVLECKEVVSSNERVFLTRDKNTVTRVMHHFRPLTEEEQVAYLSRLLFQLGRLEKLAVSALACGKYDSAETLVRMAGEVNRRIISLQERSEFIFTLREEEKKK